MSTNFHEKDVNSNQFEQTKKFISRIHSTQITQNENLLGEWIGLTCIVYVF